MAINKIEQKSKKPLIIFGVIGAILITGSITGVYYYTKNKSKSIKTITVQDKLLEILLM